MSLLQQFLKHPQQLWFRRLNFQIHLWAGILLAVYASTIGITGSILVFGSELDHVFTPEAWPGISFPQNPARLGLVIDHLTARYPHTHIVSVFAPTPANPVFIATLQRHGRTVAACHPVTGQVLVEVPPTHSRIGWVYDLHENLFARRPGRVVNGIASAALILLACTGLINWWPGLQSIRRALSIDFRRRWKRINFDLHGAVGFWSFGFLILWATSGVYFAWPDKVLTLVNRISPVVNSRPPAVIIDSYTDIVKLDFDSMLADAQARVAGAQFKGIIFPSSRRSPMEVLLSRSPGVARDYEDTLYFNPYNGEYISTWQYGVNETLGDWIIWLQIPLHFGTHWGLVVKLLWAAIGFSLPLLSISGLLMYWNRVLSKKWARRVSL